MRDLKSPKYKKWRTQVFRRDNYTCLKCGAKKHLEAHHISDWAGNEEDRFNVENGATLCVKDHEAFHRKYGKGKNNIYQLEKFIGKVLNKERMPKLF